MLRRLAGSALLLAALAGAASAQPADTLLLDGKIVRFDAEPAEALAIRNGRIAAIGTSADIRAHAGPATQIIDLGGRTVIPGLIDSHIHAIRAGLTYTTEVHWIGARSIPEALERLRAAAARTPKGSWLIVAGGWIEGQFAEKRRPTQAEIAVAAPGHHVYVQVLYSAVLMGQGDLEALGVLNDTELASRLTVELDPAGQPTGWIGADARTISELFDRLPRPALEQQIAGTRAFFRALNSLGITGVIDPGGYNLPLEAYRALFQIWRERGLTLRVVYSLCAPRRNHELADFQALTAMLPMGFGDEWLRFNGIGENVTWGMYNNEAPTEAQKDQLYQVLRWAVSQGLTATFHWNNNGSVRHLLDVLERVDREARLAPLRWSVAHLNDASLESLQRMKALGVGWLMQNALYFRGEAFLGQRGLEAVRLMPPIGTAMKLGLPIGGGTDAHRVMSYNSFISLQWMVDGKTVAGMGTRSGGEIPTRLEALKFYTQGSAWFAFDEGNRGALAVGQLADLAVLSKDYLGVPVDEIGSIQAVLTMIGGRVVFAEEPYGALEAGSRGR